MTTEEIRAELQDVRYYYSRKAMFDRAKACVAKNAAVALAEKYGNAVRDAPPRLYDIYVTLYVENNTQASAAEKWGYSEGYIRNLNRRLRLHSGRSGVFLSGGNRPDGGVRHSA